MLALLAFFLSSYSSSVSNSRNLRLPSSRGEPLIGDGCSLGGDGGDSLRDDFSSELFSSTSILSSWSPSSKQPDDVCVGELETSELLLLMWVGGGEGGEAAGWSMGFKESVEECSFGETGGEGESS